MDTQQNRDYTSAIADWASRAATAGWDEDGPETELDHELDVDMVDYRVAGLFEYSDGGTTHLFTMPECDILARVARVKAHMNRMISAVEFARDALGGDSSAPHPIPVWDFARKAVENLRDTHHGTRYRVLTRARIATRLEGHCTGIPSTLPWNLETGYELDASRDPRLREGRYLFGLGATFFTTCPFVLHETDAKQSHTQRTHVTVRVVADRPVDAAPLMTELCDELTPVMSNMKIPDEVVQTLRSYSSPTFTEDGVMKVHELVKAVAGQIVPGGGISSCTISARSEDSHLAHDVLTTLDRPDGLIA